MVAHASVFASQGILKWLQNLCIFLVTGEARSMFQRLYEHRVFGIETPTKMGLLLSGILSRYTDWPGLVIGGHSEMTKVIFILFVRSRQSCNDSLLEHYMFRQ